MRLLPLSLLLLLCPLLEAQPIGVGIKGGLPLSDAFQLAGEPATADRQRWVAGPYLEFRLPARFAIEIGAMYEGLRFDYRIGRLLLGNEVWTTTASTWQFPLLLKYRFGGDRFRPFVSGGVAAYRTGGVKQIGELIPDLPGLTRDPINRVGNSFVNGGGVVGGGLELKAGPFRIAPEVRFSRWTAGKTVGTNDIFVRMNQSQTQLLVGFGF